MYSYSDTGSLVTSEAWGGVVSGTVSFSYDSYFRVANETAGGVTATYTYSGDGLISEVDLYDSSSTLLTNGTFTLTYDPDNGASQFTGDPTGRRPNGMLYTTSVGSVSDTRTYNGFGELATYSAGDGTNTYLAYVLDTSGATRDQLGRITERTESAPSVRAWDFSYSAEGWLSAVSSGGTAIESYT